MSWTLHVSKACDWWCAWVFKIVIRMIMWGCLKVFISQTAPFLFVTKRMCQWRTRWSKVDQVSCKSVYLLYWQIKNAPRKEMRWLVGILGLEPRMTGPESVVLPLHHIPMLVLRCKVTTFFAFSKRFINFFVFILRVYSKRCLGLVCLWNEGKWIKDRCCLFEQLNVSRPYFICLGMM